MSYSMSDLLQLVVSEGSSDLHIRVGVPPVIRVHGILHRVEGPALGPEDTEELARSITSEDHIQHVRERGGADFGFAFGDLARFRVSVFKEKGNFGMVLRQIPNKLLELDKIGLPPSVRELLYKPRGLVLVTGPTGSGKSTTLASMINVINEERRALAGAGGTGDEHQTAGLVEQFADGGRQANLVEFEELVGNLAQHHSEVALFLEDADAETGEVAEGEAEVGAAAF